MSYFIPKKLKYGKDIRNIIFKQDTVIKFFKNKDGYVKTIKFFDMINNTAFFPKLIEKDELNLKLTMENCGNLLSLFNLPNDWENQLLELGKIFKQKQIYILDLRFLPYSPYVINNLCIKKIKIKAIDLTLYRKRPNYYINYRINLLVTQIKLYKIFINYSWILFIIHIIFEIFRLLSEVVEIVLFRDVSIFYECNYCIKTSNKLSKTI